MLDLNKIYCGDARDVLSDIDDNSIDLVVTSPPYDDLRKYNNPESSWNFKVFQEIAKELYRVVKDGGVVVWVVNDKVEKGSKTLTSFRQALYFQEIGFNVNDVMMWRKTNPMPQVKQPRYCSCYDYMMIFSKGKPKTFNPIMVNCKLGGKEYNSTAKNMGGENGRRKLHYNVNRQKVKDNIWDIAIAQNKTDHPAVYPLQIARDHILSWTNEGDVVLDPFLGSGTTALACKQAKRKYIGIEINPEYCEIAEKQLAQF